MRGKRRSLELESIAELPSLTPANRAVVRATLEFRRALYGESEALELENELALARKG
jgi:hypothetical protein